MCNEVVRYQVLHCCLWPLYLVDITYTKYTECTFSSTHRLQVYRRNRPPQPHLNPADSTVAVVIYPPVVCTILPRMQMFEKGRKSKQR